MNETLLSVDVVINYCDGSSKHQQWSTKFLSKTDRLVFGEAFMDEVQRDKYSKTHRDWRDNPCLVRYRYDGGAPEQICMRGRREGDKRNRSWAHKRGTPHAIGFDFVNRADQSHFRMTYGRDWLAETGELTLVHDPATGAAAGVLRRMTDGTETALTPSEGQVLAIIDEWDAYPCGFPSFFRKGIA